MATITTNCPHCRRAIELETTDVDVESETSKRLRRKLNAASLENAKLAEELGLVKRDRDRFIADSTNYLHLANLAEAELQRFKEVAKVRSAVPVSVPWFKRWVFTRWIFS